MKSTRLENASKEEVLIALKETEQYLIQANQNLGHPAYGLSSGVTTGIDDLREEIFNYLEL